MSVCIERVYKSPSPLHPRFRRRGALRQSCAFASAFWTAKSGEFPPQPPQRLQFVSMQCRDATSAASTLRARHPRQKRVLSPPSVRLPAGSFCCSVFYPIASAPLSCCSGSSPDTSVLYIVVLVAVVIFSSAGLLPGVPDECVLLPRYQYLPPDVVLRGKRPGLPADASSPPSPWFRWRDPSIIASASPELQ